MPPGVLDGTGVTAFARPVHSRFRNAGPYNEATCVGPHPSAWRTFRARLARRGGSPREGAAQRGTSGASDWRRGADGPPTGRDIGVLELRCARFVWARLLGRITITILAN